MFVMKNWFEWDGGEGIEGKVLYSLPVNSTTQVSIEPGRSKEGKHHD
jgi:hypothetical protein